jgi:hypothetical protein
MFWPSDHPGEADDLGKRGFWLCAAIAVLSMAMMMLQGNLILAGITAVFFLLGGMGVREHSQPAATLVAAAYILNLFAALAQGNPPGALTIIATLLLLGNIRATHIAAKWAGQGDPEMMPERRSASTADFLVDQMPARVWPKARIPFFVLAGIYVALSLLGVVMLLAGLTPRRQPVQPIDPGATYDVSPAR